MMNLGPPMTAKLDAKSLSKPDKAIDSVKQEPDSFKDTLKVSQNERPLDRAQKQESREPQIEKKIKSSDTVSAKSLSERQKVMQKFMDSMESEFGIPPERIVEAMTELSDPQLLASPEDTASQVIAKLDLSPEDSEKAQAMYMSMLLQLSGTLPQIRDPEPLLPKEKMLMAATAGLGGREYLSARERKAALNQSLDQMNQKFFMKEPVQGQIVTDPLSSDLSKDLGQLSQETDFKLNSYIHPKKGIDVQKLQTYEQIKSIPTADVSATKANSAEALNQQSSDADQMDLLKGLSALAAAAGALSEAVKEDPGNQAALKMEKVVDGIDTKMMMNSEFGKIGENLEQSSDFGNSNSDEGKPQDQDSSKAFSRSMSVEKSDFFINPKATSEMTNTSLNQKTSFDIPQIAPATTQVGGEKESDINIKQIMNQTQYMIKKGGGEATVRMSPEGLGQVHLKVILNEGKVNIQMSAENNEAKKIIESHIGDLKATLNTHKLSVDQVKVDVGNQLANQNDNSQNSSQFRQDPGREQARQFLGQFRDENSNRRDPFYEMPGIKSYADKTRGPDPLKSSAESRSAAMNRYKGSGKGSGLDLVA
jgi:flagellar hook-length control protein FliK